jgi:hypothetical protein
VLHISHVQTICLKLIDTRMPHLERLGCGNDHRTIMKWVQELICKFNFALCLRYYIGDMKESRFLLLHVRSSLGLTGAGNIAHKAILDLKSTLESRVGKY